MPTTYRDPTHTCGDSRLTSHTRKRLTMLAHNVHMMSSDKKRVQFRAPGRLIDRVDALATVLGEDRTDVLITALREYLQDASHDDAITQEIATAYYDDKINYEQLKTLVGSEEAAKPPYAETTTGRRLHRRSYCLHEHVREYTSRKRPLRRGRHGRVVRTCCRRRGD